MLVSCIAGVASAGGRDDLRGRVRRRAASHGHDLHSARAQEEGAEQPDGAGAEDQRGLRVPGRETALDEIRLPQRFLDDRERLHQDADVR